MGAVTLCIGEYAGVDFYPVAPTRRTCGQGVTSLARNKLQGECNHAHTTMARISTMPGSIDEAIQCFGSEFKYM